MLNYFGDNQSVRTGAKTLTMWWLSLLVDLCQVFQSGSKDCTTRAEALDCCKDINLNILFK